MSNPKPTLEMLQWHDCEIGMFFHYDIETFDLDWRFGMEQLPDVSLWNPTKLDTDQWVRAAKSAGAKYALLTAKHCTGFCLWPTESYDYHVGNSPVPIDIVGEFISSCHKHGIKPGLYYSIGAEYIYNISKREDGSLDAEKRNQIIEMQLRELLTNYGPLFELWFDGGIPRVEDGYLDVVSIVNEIQPDSICFGGIPGMKNVLRWSGSEQGVVLEECWSTAHYEDEPGRKVHCNTPGSPDDPIWAPVECDLPSRDVIYAYMGGWVDHPNDADKTYSSEYLFARYLTSVGRNANMLLGAVPNTQGLISEDQVESFIGFDNLVNSRLGVPVGQTFIQENDNMAVWLDNPVDAAFIDIMEDQSEGQNILEWVVETRWPETWCVKDGLEHWIPIASGKSIGHRRILQLNHLNGYAFRVRILKAKPGAKLTRFAVYGKTIPMFMHEDLNV